MKPSLTKLLHPFRPKVTAVVEKYKIKRLTGVKTKELLLWITLTNVEEVSISIQQRLPLCNRLYLILSTSPCFEDGKESNSTTKSSAFTESTSESLTFMNGGSLGNVQIRRNITRTQQKDGIANP
ncbi:hypothetical protein COLO4_25852 [Corchorus olitorius]|uniref:Uncharacterized protein n=1 Tax=Corchorus olitorius TaxID=93759 RepID=A0A1R3HZT8_9ROSI|nr:hypothetical protein COLO4_25852 [Corchorus olitorius]